MRKFVVQLELGVWLAPWSGDPGRTLALDEARLFQIEGEARRALVATRRYRPFAGAKIVPVDVTVKPALLAAQGGEG